MARTLGDLHELTGKELFCSDWVRLGADDERAFADASFLREDFLGAPPANGDPYGDRLISGFLLLSLLVAFHKRELDLDLQGAYGLNYGVDKVRFLRPVLAGERVRLRARLVEAREKEPGRVRVLTRNVLEVEDADTPAMVADWISLFVAPEEEGPAMPELPGEEVVPRVGRVAGYLDHWASRTPDAPLDELDGTGRAPRTYGHAADDVARCAAALRASGVRHGDRVAVLTTPRPEFLTLFLALSRIGAVWVGLNPRYTRDELLHVVTDSEPVLLVSLAEHDGRSYAADMAALRDAAGSVRETVALTGAFPGAVPFEEFVARAGEPSGESSSEGSDDDPGLVIYTSGTTGRPKGAVISHRAFAEGCRLQATRLHHSPAAALANLPVSHVGGVMDVVSVPLAMGGAVCFMEDFDPAAIPAAVERARVTIWGQIPTMFQMVMARPEFAEADLSSLVYVAWGGAPLPRELVPPLRATGARLTSVYGLTESCVAVAYNDPDADDETLATTIGRPDPRLELRLAGADGTPVAPGTPGEIQLRNPCLMSGYLGAPDATAAAFTPDGFLRTGDVAVERPDGTLTLVGRLKEMFKSGGYNVYPREIELALEAHPDVAAAAVVAMPDPVFHEVGAAFVMTRPGAGTGPDDLDRHCRTRLAAHKVPKHFEIVDGLPLLATGKVDKEALRRALPPRP
ncbi:AMP-binding protein [Actinomadura livida]|uniref:Acyl-CoA synthetase (AMP-forming)/AMP-acid ligase II/acyl dehydratase n=1 Tax=Actinomadura livida TaxID=79909 RepID=A0A7W7I8Q2_9ACTN|nr:MULTISPECIES: AMP-binding protein [Actinomadura]MBB4772572.1 acyl-CoA synthetase (AMP-forming)/AMP-acid ligase II/acyl dehydratase [Actinomadura catellatispora]GGU22097.1 hypothetical protein GCM10010208_53590 [Actinomadura livida]